MRTEADEFLKTIHKMLVRRSLCAASGSVAIFSLLLSANAPVSYEDMFLIAAVSASAALILNLLLAQNRSNYSKKLLGESLIDALYRIRYRRAQSGSYMKAAQEVASACSLKELGSALSRASKKFFMGLELLDSISEDTIFKEHRAVESLRGGGADEIDQKLSERALQGERERADLEESLSRHATVNMFLSTVLPSFILFVFVGSMVIAQQAASLLLLSIAFIALLPVLYALGNSLFYRKLFA